MKIEDMKFPIDARAKDSSCDYKIKFRRRTFFNKCCGERGISGWIESRDTSILIKGFKLKKGDSGFEWLGGFMLCPRCGEIKAAYSGVRPAKDIIIKEWLKIINNKRRYNNKK